MNVAADCRGIVVHGSLTRGETATVTVHGRERIAATLAAARRHLRDTDDVTTTLERAVAEDLDAIDLPECWDENDARVLADVLDDVRNGNDGAPARAAARLRTLPRSRVTCPHCNGDGEVYA